MVQCIARWASLKRRPHVRSSSMLLETGSRRSLAEKPLFRCKAALRFDDVTFERKAPEGARGIWLQLGPLWRIRFRPLPSGRAPSATLSSAILWSSTVGPTLLRSVTSAVGRDSTAFSFSEVAGLLEEEFAIATWNARLG